MPRDCAAQRLDPASAGVALHTWTAPAAGLVTIDLTGGPAGDWDLAAFHRGEPAAAGASTAFGSTERVTAWVARGERPRGPGLPACHRGAGARAARFRPLPPLRRARDPRRALHARIGGDLRPRRRGPAGGARPRRHARRQRDRGHRCDLLGRRAGAARRRGLRDLDHGRRPRRRRRGVPPRRGAGRGHARRFGPSERPHGLPPVLRLHDRDEGPRRGPPGDRDRGHDRQHARGTPDPGARDRRRGRLTGRRPPRVPEHGRPPRTRVARQESCRWSSRSTS